jgi:hypothetical protein
VNLEADSTTSFLGQRPLAATCEQVETSVKDSGSNRYLILRKTGGRSFLAAKLNGGNSFFGIPRVEGRGTSGLCGLSAAESIYLNVR